MPRSKVRNVEFGFYLPDYCKKGQLPDIDFLCDYAKRAEKLGFDSLWVPEHLLVAGPSYKVSFPEPLVVLSALASVTRKPFLGTSILVLPLRHPVILAKQAATLDALAKGRLILGVGAGWFEKEFEACGIPIGERGTREQEIIEILIRLWTGNHVSYHGKFYSFNDVSLDPKPAKKPHPPIWMGGGTLNPSITPYLSRTHWQPDVVLRRIAKYADGWVTAYRSLKIGGEPMELIERDWRTISDYAREFRRDPSKIQRAHMDHMFIFTDGKKSESRLISYASKFTPQTFSEIKERYVVGTPEEVAKKIRTRIRGGITHVLVNPISPEIEQLEEFASSVIPLVQ